MSERFNRLLQAVLDASNAYGSLDSSHISLTCQIKDHPGYTIDITTFGSPAKSIAVIPPDGKSIFEIRPHGELPENYTETFFTPVLEDVLRQRKAALDLWVLSRKSEVDQAEKKIEELKKTAQSLGISLKKFIEDPHILSKQGRKS